MTWNVLALESKLNEILFMVNDVTIIEGLNFYGLKRGHNLNYFYEISQRLKLELKLLFL